MSDGIPIEQEHIRRLAGTRQVQEGR